jgi:hypothetical protein
MKDKKKYPLFARHKIALLVSIVELLATTVRVVPISKCDQEFYQKTHEI